LVNLTETNKFIAFGVVILIWELIPTSVVIILFRLKLKYCCSRNNDRRSYANNNASNVNVQSTVSVFLDTETASLDDSLDVNPYLDEEENNVFPTYQSTRNLIYSEIY